MRNRHVSMTWAAIAIFLALPLLSARALQEQVAAVDGARTDQRWNEAAQLIEKGEFARAKSEYDLLPNTPLTEKVRGWLDAFLDEQSKRLALNQEDYEKYVRYAKERLDRGEYALALEKIVLAADNAADPKAFKREPWVKDAIAKALDEGVKLRSSEKWEDSWEIYYFLGMIDETNPTYKKLERDCVTHLRLDRMFDEDEHVAIKWEEMLEGVNLGMAMTILDDLARYYVDENLDFRALTITVFEHLLLLSDSTSARKTFPKLADEVVRKEFQGRIQERLNQVRAANQIDVTSAKVYFQRIWEINRETLDLPEKLVVSEMVRAAMDTLDDFTSPIWPREWEDFAKNTDGDFVGVGISIIQNQSDEVEVVTPLEDAPAYRAGIVAGDIITHADGKPMLGVSINKVVDFITGPEGTDVTLTIRRGEKSFDVVLKRQRVVIQTVKGLNRLENDPEHWNHWLDKENGIAYVRVTSFARNTVELVEKTLSQLKAEGMQGLVFDLRGNPGGLLESAEGMSSLFLGSNEKVHSIKGRIERDNKSFVTLHEGPFKDVPMVVLVNEYSASASEIVSGALRDNHRALVLGTNTYGKFSVQNLLPVSNAPRAALKITTARYYLPSGVSLHRDDNSQAWGVEPNIKMPLVRKEQIKLLQMQRKANVLGKTPLDEAEAALDKKGAEGEAAKPEGEAADAKTAESAEAGKEGEKVAEGDGKAEKNALPPLKQPDSNDRPEADPQLDAAELLLRVKLLTQNFPVLAEAPLKQGAEPVHK